MKTLSLYFTQLNVESLKHIYILIYIFLVFLKGFEERRSKLPSVCLQYAGSSSKK